MKKIFLSAIMGFSTLALAQENTQIEKDNQHFFNHNIDYQVKANASIGGSSPIAWGLPREIRKIENYTPLPDLGLEINATKWLSDQQKWGIRVGLRSETKGMKTKARVKNYHTEISQEGDKLQGYFTGLVETKVKNTYITIPVSAVYKLSPKWNIYAGLYVSSAVDKTFEGNVSDGYLHQDTPVGNKVLFDNDSFATYDYSNEVRTFQWGAQIGTEWYFAGNFFFFPELNYGFNQIFNSDFKTISYSLHNIYLNVGFGYKF